WALSWLILAKADHFFGSIKSEHKVALLVLPAAMSLLSLATENPAIFIVLNLLNTFVFAIVAWRSSSVKLPAVLGGASLLAAFVAVPESWAAAVIKDYNKAEILVAIGTVAGLWISLRRRTARGAMLGSACVGMMALGFCEHFKISHHVIIQMAAMYYLLHSLWWSEKQERGSTFSVVAMGVIWWADSFSFGQSNVRYGMWAPSVIALVMFAVAWGARFLAGKSSKLVMAASIGVFLINPIYRTIVWLTSAPS